MFMEHHSTITGFIFRPTEDATDRAGSPAPWQNPTAPAELICLTALQRREAKRFRKGNRRNVSVIAESAQLNYFSSVNETVSPTPAPRPADKLALAQAAFREFHARCFWFMRPDAEIVAEEVPYICERLRADGGRRGFYLAADLCR